MALSLQQIRDYVRTSLDVEVEDLPDALLDVYIREGSKRIERAEVRWPFYEAQFTASLGAGTSSVTRDSISEQLDQIQAIVHIDGAHPPLSWVGFDVLTELQKQQTEGQSRPHYFAEFGQSVHFFPRADLNYDMTVYGFRKADDWVAAGAGATPDLPDELHNTVAMWALARAYAQQEDPELAGIYERQFADELNMFRRRLVVTPLHQPLILNGGSLGQHSNTMLSRPRYDWEPGI